MDFVHVMSLALAQSSAAYLVWLEDDAVLLPRWPAALAAADRQCLVALHPCNCARCTPTLEYNGVGAVALLFRRDRLAELLPPLAARARARNAPPLDELLEALCAERAGALGPAKYLLPPAANHTSDIARGTTKPSQAVRVRIVAPAAGAALAPEAPVLLRARFSGMVFDAEYSWSVVVDRGAGSPRESFKLFRPRREEDCSDEPAWEGTARLTGLGPGWHVAEIQVFEEESEEKLMMHADWVDFEVLEEGA